MRRRGRERVGKGEEEEEEEKSVYFEEGWRRKRKESRYRKGKNLIALLTFLTTTTTTGSQISLVEAQCPANSMTSFERIGGVAIKDSPLTILYTAPNSSVNNMRIISGSEMTRQLEQQQSTVNIPIPITAECNNRCRRSNKCRAFLVDYARHTCYSVEHNGPSSSARPIQLIATQERTSYFEKVCLSLVASECERAWIFERVIGYHLLSNDDRIVEEVPNRLRCQELCLSEREFRCRSGEYDSYTMQCRLSSHDRHSKPAAFRASAGNSDYFENQCAPIGSQCNAFDRYEDLDLGRAEIMRSANSSDQCQQFCTQTIKAFICRSFTWNPSSGKCYLNSANSFMVGGLDRLINAPGLIYFQRNECIDLKLDCDTTAMTLNLRTNEPFRGRMYVRDEPNACEIQGRAALSSSLSIPFQSQARCATREPPNRYSSVVVVQQHPMIQRKTDRYIKVVCDFQTANKTITSQYNVNANPWTSAAMINYTSFAPQIRLRITDKFGVDITGAKLGDELYLRIEATSESVYDMMARSVIAKSGTPDESIVLIDKDGCPTDFRIFPTLKKLNRRTIIGKFDAFKFSSDVVVRFQVDVQFCLNECPPISCDGLNGPVTNLLLNAQPSEALEAAATTPNPVNSASDMMRSGANQQQAPLGDSSLVVASTFSSTQAPPSLSVPFNLPRLQTSQLNSMSSSSSNSASQIANFSSPNGPSHYPNSPYANPATPLELSNYYYASGAAISGNRHPSAPANQPPASSSSSNALNYTGVLMDNLPLGSPSSSSINSAADSQMFEPSQLQAGMRSRPQTQSASLGGTNSAGDQLGNGARAARRRRRAFEVNDHHQYQQPVDGVQNPQPIPLQREIIVESSAPNQAVNSRPEISRSQQKEHKVKARTFKSMHTNREGRRTGSTNNKLDGFNRNEPTYELNGNNKVDLTEEQQQQVDNSGTLLCTTRHSLVIASMAFCTVQFLTVALCLLTWMHRRDTKFKVRQSIQERLY